MAVYHESIIYLIFIEISTPSSVYTVMELVEVLMYYLQDVLGLYLYNMLTKVWRHLFEKRNYKIRFLFPFILFEYILARSLCRSSLE